MKLADRIGSANPNCDPHQPGSQKVVVSCPATGADWAIVPFVCGRCQR